MSGPFEDKRAALINEGMTEAEADFMIGGGTGTLETPADTTAAPAAPETAAPAVTDAPATQPRDDDEDEAPPSDSPFYQQWHREKRKRQDLQTKLREREEALTQHQTELTSYRERFARVDERLRMFNQALTPATPQRPAAPPDPETDPFGYMKWQGEQIEELKRQNEEASTTFQERDAATALQQHYTHDARNFAAKTPDFGQAYSWLMTNRDAELAAAGYADKAERDRIILADERDIVQRALSQRQSNQNAPGPAQVIYQLAKARGFTAPAVAPVAAAAAPAASTATDQVRNIEKAKAASRSLSSGGGAPVPQALDLNRIANMSDAEYAEFRRGLTPAQSQKFNAMIGAM